MLACRRSALSLLFGIGIFVFLWFIFPSQALSLQAEIKEEEWLMFNLINEARTQKGLSELEFDLELSAVAAMHAKDMVERNYFAHQTPDGESPADRVLKQNISFKVLGENLAGNIDVEDAHRMLMNSDGHRANILDGRFGRVGVGIVKCVQYGKMMVQKFADGSPSPGGKLPQDFVMSEGEYKELALTPTEVSVVIEQDPVVFPDVKPCIVDGRTLVPLRGVFEAMEAEVSWDPATRTVTAVKKGSTVEIVIGNEIMKVNGQPVKLDVPAQIVEGRTLVPLRAVSESLGVHVNWSKETRTVSISSN